MAIIGFFLVIGLGILLIIAGVLIALASMGFGGRIKFIDLILIPTCGLCGTGTALIICAVKYSPLAITIVNHS